MSMRGRSNTRGRSHSGSAGRTSIRSRPGGNYDGVVGIVAPLEVLRANPAAPLELIIFAEEEGTTFNLGMLGSRALVGTLSVEQLSAVRNKHGQNYWQAGANFGADPERLAADRFNARRTGG